MKEKVKDYFKQMFKETKEACLIDIMKTEKRNNELKKALKKAIREKWVSNFKKAKIKLEKKQKDISVSGSCDFGKRKCNLVVNFCIKIFELNFKDKFVFPLKIFPILDFAVSINPTIKLEMCAGGGPNFYLDEPEKNTFDLEISLEATIGATLDIGLFAPAANSPAKISINAGLSGVLILGKVGIKLSFFYEKKFIFDAYYEYKAFELSLYIIAKISIKILAVDFSFTIPIYNLQIFSLINEDKHIKQEIYY